METILEGKEVLYIAEEIAEEIRTLMNDGAGDFDVEELIDNYDNEEYSNAAKKAIYDELSVIIADDERIVHKPILTDIETEEIEGFTPKEEKKVTKKKSKEIDMPTDAEVTNMKQAKATAEKIAKECSETLLSLEGSEQDAVKAAWKSYKDDTYGKKKTTGLKLAYIKSIQDELLNIRRKGLEKSGTDKKAEEPAKAKEVKKKETKKKATRKKKVHKIPEGHVELTAFSGMHIAILPILKDTGKTITIHTTYGGDMKFDKKTLKQKDAENPRYANKIRLPE